MFLTLWLRSPHEPFGAAETYRDEEIDPGPAHAEADVSDKHPWVRTQEAKSRRAITDMGRERFRMLEGSAAAMVCVRNAMGRWDEQDDTYYVFLPDSGYQFGEHGPDSKALPHEVSVRVPLHDRRVCGCGGTARYSPLPFGRPAGNDRHPALPVIRIPSRRGADPKGRSVPAQPPQPAPEAWRKAGTDRGTRRPGAAGLPASHANSAHKRPPG